MHELLGRRFLFIAGKGGVGRTTVAAAFALAATKQGKRVLFAMCNAKERLSSLLEVSPVTDQVRQVLPLLDAVNMSPVTALKEYGTIVLRIPSLARAVFENRFVASFLRGTPGIAAWAMLGKAYYHGFVERTPTGQPRYDLVILDAPATGHSLDMLRVPKVIVDMAPPGLLYREADRAWTMFKNTTESGFVVVTLPEEMPATESIELYGTLRRELDLPLSLLVINGVVPAVFAREERLLMANLPRQLAPGSPLEPYAIAARRRVLREALQEGHITRLTEEIDLPQVHLPFLFDLPFGRSSVEALAQELDR